MKIKKKLLLGFGLLFVVVLVFGGVALYYIEVISETSNMTLKNNYETLTFTREMRSVLDENDLPLNTQASQTFDNALKKQENNITERGEREATAGVRQAFTLLTDAGQNLAKKQAAERNIRSLLKTIDGLNMRAIVVKNDATHKTVNDATLYLGGMVFITFLILFILILNFPAFIINPLNDFKDALHEVSKKNYDTRLNFKTSEEFAVLASEFNTMADKLDERETADLTRIMSDEIRIKTLIEEMPEVVIGLNEKQEVLFLNTPAAKILNISDKHITGNAVHELVKNNTLLKMIIDNKDTAKPLKVPQNEQVSYFRQKNFEIVAPNLKLQSQGVLQFAGYPAGMIYILKQVTAHDKVIPGS
ncbi:MAG TPA: HAMP domain-containing protein [Mucilaginibacter sp.]|nr:HAMP domain-containing protein [Mucilaginibacter sp.]